MKDSMKESMNQVKENVIQVKEDVGQKIVTVKVKAKSGLFHLIFSRITVVAVFLLLQLALLWASVTYLSEYNSHFVTFSWLLSFILIIVVVNKPGNPAFKQTWTITILALPIFGAFFYLFLKIQQGEKKIHERLDELWIDIRPHLKQDEEVIQRLKAKRTPHVKLANYLVKQVGYPIYTDTEVQYYKLGEEKLEALLRELKLAKKFIFMEYFIIEFGYMWDSILEVLEEKAKEGVEVRLMYDGTCSISHLPSSYPRQLRAKGINCKVFNPIVPILTTHQNNRDHRKICVIDGQTGFTGGINLGDEYINYIERFGHWKDTAVMLKGKAVKSFTMMFLQMWNMNEKSIEDYGKYIPEKMEFNAKTRGFVLPYGDIPLDSEDVGEQVYSHIINNAERYVHIMTPYLIINNEMIADLTSAAKSGIEVIIIMPHIPDKWYAFAVAKTYFGELIQAGVQIYEYVPGFVHAKVFVSDDTSATCGTVNMDFRSLYLHYECGAFIYDNPVVHEIERDFRNTLAQSKRISILDVENRNVFEKVVGKVLRLLAPLM